MARDDFSSKVKKKLEERAGHTCSNPTCGRPTSRPGPTYDSSVRVGVAAHIAAASPGGPRFDEAMTKEQRESIENGIWLCSFCAHAIDVVPEAFPADALRVMRRDAESRASIRANSNAAIVDVLAAIDEASAAVQNFINGRDIPVESRFRQLLSESHILLKRDETDEEGKRIWDEAGAYLVEESMRLHHSYMTEVSPLVAKALARISEILPPAEQLLLEKLVREAETAQINRLGRESLGDVFIRVRTLIERR